MVTGALRLVTSVDGRRQAWPRAALGTDADILGVRTADARKRRQRQSDDGGGESREADHPPEAVA